MDRLTLFVGENIRRAGDALASTPLTAVAERLRTDERLRADTESLRSLLRMDPRAYKQSKPRLPYFCVSAFDGGVRRMERFAVAHAMAFDIDWGATDQRAAAEVRAAMYADPRCALAYVTPSGTNWRCVYALAEPIAEAHVYRAVYRRLASQLQEDFPDLRGLDAVTHDPTRASFLAYDPAAHVHPEASAVAWAEWTADLRLGGGFGVSPTDVPPASVPPVTSPTPPPYRDIRRALQPERRGNVIQARGQTKAIVPTEVLALIPAWNEALDKLGFRALEEKPIPYGIQVLVHDRTRRAVLNITYGRKGFRFVPVGKSGTDQTLAKELAAVLEDESYGHGDYPEGLPALATAPSFLDGLSPKLATAPRQDANAEGSAGEHLRPSPPPIVRTGDTRARKPRRPNYDVPSAPPFGQTAAPPSVADDDEEIPW